MSDEEARQKFLRQLAQLAQSQNATGLDDFLGLTPGQMDRLLYHPLEEGCVVQWATTIDDTDVSDTPFMRAMDHLLGRLAKQQVKLTAKGNLPRALVRNSFGRTGRCFNSWG